MSAFAGADADRVLDRDDEDLAVSDLARLGGAHERVDHGLRALFGHDDVDPQLRVGTVAETVASDFGKPLFFGGLVTFAYFKRNFMIGPDDWKLSIIEYTDDF